MAEWATKEPNYSLPPSVDITIKPRVYDIVWGPAKDVVIKNYPYGREVRWTAGEKDTIIPGNDGDPDTVRTRKYHDPVGY